jgi:hypothetical protein
LFFTEKKEGQRNILFSLSKGSGLTYEFIQGGQTMASKAKANNKGQEVIFAPGTRQEQVHPSLATLTRMPLALPVAKAPKADAKKDFILGLLQEAGSQGITWVAIQAALLARYGQAPKKRAVLYAILAGTVYHKTLGAKGVVTYAFGKAPKNGKSKAK